jgi:hypothetical protein
MNVRGVVAYNAESKVIETVRPNGILIAQITPRGGIYLVLLRPHLDAWNWEGAILERMTNSLNFPSSFNRYSWGADPAASILIKNYKQVDETRTFLSNIYLADPGKDRNLIYLNLLKVYLTELKPYLFTLQEQLQIVDAVNLAVKAESKKMVVWEDSKL